MTPKERILGLFRGQVVDRVACFTGMGTVWGPALQEYRYEFSEVHHDVDKMVRVATFPAEVCGYECAVVPFDLCVEAELLGCEMNTFPGREKPLYPNIRKRVIQSEADIEQLQIPEDISTRARIPLVFQAIQKSKARVGNKVPIGSYVLGPYTLAGQIMDLNDLMRLTLRKPEKIAAMLDVLTELIIGISRVYQEAGVDYLCVREMGATTDILPPQIFEQLIQPRLKRLLVSIDCPKVLHICGGSLGILDMMVACGADAISVENKNRLKETREKIGGKHLIFGNIDGYGVLVKGTQDEVYGAVLQCLKEGSDGLWPSCEISLEAPLTNLTSMIKAVREYGAQYWARRSTC